MTKTQCYQKHMMTSTIYYQCPAIFVNSESRTDISSVSLLRVYTVMRTTLLAQSSTLITIDNAHPQIITILKVATTSFFSTLIPNHTELYYQHSQFTEMHRTTTNTSSTPPCAVPTSKQPDKVTAQLTTTIFNSHPSNLLFHVLYFK